MIVVRAPLRISFVGGGTDIASFYSKDPGQVLSVTIDKYVYLSINPTPHIDKIGAKYSITELVDSPKSLKHKRIREALIDFDINNNIEIGSFADIPSGTGLGSSSAFSVALVRGLHTYKGVKIGREEAAQYASRLEIDLCKEPIGKQDQYASAYGGFNIFRFKKGGSVETEPIFLDYKKKLSKSIIAPLAEKIKVEYLEEKINSPHTYDLLKFLKKKNSKAKYFFLMGADNFINLHKWHNWENISKLCKIVVFDRPGYSLKCLNSIASKKLRKKDWKFIKSKKIYISSSILRKI